MGHFLSNIQKALFRVRIEIFQVFIKAISGWTMSWQKYCSSCFRMAGIILGIIDPRHRKQHFFLEISAKLICENEIHICYFTADNFSCWNKTPSHPDKDGIRTHRKACSGPRDSSCARFRQILLVWSAAIGSSSYPLCFISGFWFSFLL